MTMTPLLLLLVTVLTRDTESAVVISAAQDSRVTHSTAPRGDVTEPMTTIIATTASEGDNLFNLKVKILSS